jgi:tripartite-type tricarboxylate transporter receptor subunit TctC
MAEQGFKGQEAETLIFILAPVGTPADIVNFVGAELRKILGTSDVQRQFDLLGFTVLATTSEQSATRIKEEIAKWSKVIADANLRQIEEK